MSERLTVSLEDGTLVKLRELAGGERKIGAYLSRLVTWLLWPYREELDAVGPVGCVIMRKDKLEDLPRAEAEAMWQATQHLLAEAEEMKSQIDGIKAIKTELLQQGQELEIKLARLQAQYNESRLNVSPAQEDSSRDDA